MKGISRKICSRSWRVPQKRKRQGWAPRTRYRTVCARVGTL